MFLVIWAKVFSLFLEVLVNSNFSFGGRNPALGCPILILVTLTKDTDTCLRAFSTQKAVFLQLHLFLLSMATICPRLFTHNCWSSSFCKTENFFAWSTKTRLNKQALFPPNLANICFAFGNSIVTDGFSKPKNQSFLVSDHHYFWGFGPTL